ncbi:hypothetical protein AMTR_s00165p00026990 [Amborella trichopoda]|uniref:Reverse transcriptase/retrotransposon-derived protein RNase H-like domain-containing protein n=1 Tax=Amborella trichopoda TaxID=13333 RepID=W1PV77_AMBTC|nr:hypothetical protein AMTR_s00165p00026990 [Amborella trichopoda]
MNTKFYDTALKDQMHEQSYRYRAVHRGLLKKGCTIGRSTQERLTRELDTKCKEAFEDLKNITCEPVLWLPDHAVPFKVHSDDSDFAIGGVLVQLQ